MSAEDWQRRGLDRLTLADQAMGEGDPARAEVHAALATANLEAANVQMGLAVTARRPGHPLDDSRELRAWCLDRALSIRGFHDDEGIDSALAAAEKMRAYITTGGTDG